MATIRVSSTVDPKAVMEEEEKWFETLIQADADRWEPKLEALRLPANPSSADITRLISSLDAVLMEVSKAQAKTSSIVEKLQNGISYKRAVHKITSDGKSVAAREEEAKAKVASEGFIDVLNIAVAKDNYVHSVMERLRFKKEMLNIDERATGSFSRNRGSGYAAGARA